MDVVDQAMPDHPPAHDSKANGSIENAVKLVQGMLRTQLSCLQSRLRCKIPCQHPLMAWMVQHVAWVLTTRNRNKEGRTPYEKLKGKAFHKRMVGIGEVCLAKLSKHAVAKAEVPKLAPRWVKGVFLGYHRETHEYVFHTQGKLLRTRALQRVPASTRWNKKALEEVRLTPYTQYKKT